MLKIEESNGLSNCLPLGQQLGLKFDQSSLNPITDHTSFLLLTSSVFGIAMLVSYREHKKLANYFSGQSNAYPD
jgi:hypothetical protein